MRERKDERERGMEVNEKKKKEERYMKRKVGTERG